MTNSEALPIIDLSEFEHLIEPGWGHQLFYKELIKQAQDLVRLNCGEQLKRIAVQNISFSNAHRVDGKWLFDISLNCSSPTLTRLTEWIFDDEDGWAFLREDFLRIFLDSHFTPYDGYRPMVSKDIDQFLTGTSANYVAAAVRFFLFWQDYSPKEKEKESYITKMVMSKLNIEQLKIKSNGLTKKSKKS